MDELQPEHDILFYSSKEGQARIEVSYYGDNLWLTQKKLAELFGVDRTSITKHLTNVFDSGELDRDSVCAIFSHTARDGKNYRSQFYSLDAIIAVGYRINSYQATHFRIWATNVLREYLMKGFALDDERLKQGTRWGKDYFDELLERIREIRASERRFYQKITDIYEQCSYDYDSKAPITQIFFATVQNKLHWAIHGHTASEVVIQRADSSKPNMGLTTWKNGPQGKILKSDVSVAKNYLTEEEIKALNRLVGMYLDFAELQAERRNKMGMADWVAKLDGFLQFNEYEVLSHLGRVTAEMAKNIAHAEYEKFRPIQDRNLLSDFDRAVSKLSPPRPKRREKN